MPSDPAHTPIPGLATPAQRCAAATLDLAILAVLELLVVLVGLAVSPHDVAPGFAKVGQALGVVYLILGWGITGQTPGKRLLGLRVISHKTGRPSLGLAVLRFAGYVIASVPCHLGFLPILWDRQRRGWHDRLAGSLVVDVRRWPADPTLPCPAPAGPEPITLLRVPLAQAALAALAYAGVLLLFTRPLVLHAGDCRIGGPGHDGALFLWTLWYVGIGHHFDPNQAFAATRLYYYPTGVSLIFQSMAWFDGLMAWPLLQRLSLPLSYNLVMWVQMGVSALGTFCLARRHVASGLAAWLGGLAFGLAPYFIAQAELGHLTPVSTMALPWVALGAEGLWERRWWGAAVLAGLTIAVAGYCDFYLLICAGFIFSVVALLSGLQQRPRLLPALGRLVAVGVLAGLVLCPLLRAAVTQISSSVHIPLAWREGSVVDLGDLLSPNPRNPLVRATLGEAPQWSREGTETLGWALTALVVLGLWRGGRHRRTWLVVLATGLFLSSGMAFHAFGYGGLPLWLVMLLGGPPGNGLGVALHSGGLLGFAQDLLSGGRVGVWAAPVPNVIHQWLAHTPVITSLSSPARLMAIGMLGGGVLAALGAAWLLQAAAARPRWRRLGPVLLTLLVLGELLPTPLHISAYQRHPFYDLLRDAPGPGAIVDVPVNVFSRDVLEYQTLHHRPIAAAAHARPAADTYRYLESVPLLRLLAPEGVTERVAIPLVLDGRNAPPARAAVATDLQRLQRDGFRYFVLHKEFMLPDSLARLKALQAQQPSLRVLAEDDVLAVWELGGGRP